MQPVGQTSQTFAIRDPDVRLMLRVRGDDPAAFKELVEKYQHRLIGILAHLCGSADEAEDLAQEVFLRVYRARAEYHPQAKFSTWFFTIATTWHSMLYGERSVNQLSNWSPPPINPATCKH